MISFDRALDFVTRLMTHSGAVLLVGRIVQLANGFGLSVVLVQQFGLDAAGTYTVATVAMFVLAQVCALGLPFSLPRENLAEPDRNMTAVAGWLVSLPLGALAIVAYGLALGRDYQESVAIILFGSLGSLFALANLLNTLLLLGGRIEWSLLPPVANGVGILVGTLVSAALWQLALGVLLSRLLGSLIVLAVLPYVRVHWAILFARLRRAVGFVPTQLVLLLADHVPVLLLTGLLPRDQLGIFGLCRQMMTAADTPGWSLMEANYPRLVTTRLAAAPMLERQTLRLAVVVACVTMALSIVLANFAYGVPQFAFLMALLLPILPARYLNSLYDRSIRAAGRIRCCNQLALARLALALGLFIPGAALFGLWGAVGALALISMLSALLYGINARPMFATT